MRFVTLDCPRTVRLLTILLGPVAFAFAATTSYAATLDWKGHTWQLTSGGMAGSCQGDPKNVTIDSNGYLHLKITHDTGTWSAAELFTTDRLGFGTYQWQIDGPIDVFDRNVVLGLFPYGPAAGIGSDGTNEIDIEYSRWGIATGPNGDWTNYPASGSTVGELSYTFSLNGSTLSTSRFVWSNSSITDFIFPGLVPVTTTTGALKTWAYQPQNPTINIPQQALPLGMNLWCFSAPPSDGNPVDVVIRDFVFAPENGGTGGASSTGGVPATGGGAQTGGARPTGGSTASAGSYAASSNTGGSLTAPATGGARPTGGSMTSGGSNAGFSNTGGKVASVGTGGSVSTGGVNGAGGSATTDGGSIGNGGSDLTMDQPSAGNAGSCSCRIQGRTQSSSLGILGAVSLLALGSMRRKVSDRTGRFNHQDSDSGAHRATFVIGLVANRGSRSWGSLLPAGKRAGSVPGQRKRSRRVFG